MQGLAREAGLECVLIDWPHPNAQTWALLYPLHRAGVPLDPTYLLDRPQIGRLDMASIGPPGGFLDGVWDIGPSVLAYGWAVDPQTGKPATHVLFAASTGQVIASARVDVERADVAECHGPACRRSGFRARIPKAALENVPEILCYGYSRERRAAFALTGFFPPLS